MGKMNQFLLLFLASCFFFISNSQTTSNTSSQHHCLPDQSHTLLQLRQEFVQKRLNSDYWDYYNGSYPKMKSWKVDSDCCSWDGVTCDPENGHVVGLNLTNSWLNGRLNSNTSLFSLRHLHKLNLALNNFSSSTIPSQFGQLVSLTHLNLSFSFLSGPIRSEISWLSNLVSLDLSFNYYNSKNLNLRKIDLEALVQNMTYLRELHLDEVDMSWSLPQSPENLSSMTSLSLSWCGLHGEFPSNIFKLPKIQTIDLSGNYNLSGFLPQFRSSSSLKQLHLSSTKFSGELPNSIGNLKSLEYLDLYRTNFFGKIPNSIGNLESLIWLDLSRSNFSGELPNSIGYLSQLTSLSLSSNNFHGQLPSTLGNLAKLTSLGLSNNLFHGEIPSSLGNLSQLTSLSLSSNNFHGQLPSTWGKLAKLTSLDLSNNLFHGEIQSSLGNFTQLEYLNLWNNSFDGSFPISLTNLTKLKTIDLRSNKLRGSLPIPPLSTQYFFASNNNLTGRIPSMICKVNSLRVLDLSNNHLIGQIPQCLGNFSSSLSVLNMRNNSFQGILPETFINGSSLRTLDLSLNRIEGKIPQSLVKCRQLEVLNLGNNNMNDIFPFWLESLQELQILILRANGFQGPIWDSHTNSGFSKLHVIDLSHNNFTGWLPSEYFKTWNAMLMVHGKIKSQPKYMRDDSSYYEDSITVMNNGLEMELVKILTIFIAIDLSNNRFCGEIPDTMGNLKELIVLNLSSNSFTGLIPSSFGNLIELESLDLSQNKFLGEIPQQLTSLTFLEYLNLSQNQLIGPIPQGGQFSTFQNSSFEGNLELCGSPLLMKCENNETPTSTPSHESSFGEGSFGEGFNWKVVVIGYAYGLVIGLLIEYVITLRRPYWIERTYRVNLRRRR